MPFRNALALSCSAALALSLLATPAAAAKRALFDNFHFETAGNADWTIDDNQPTPLPTQTAIVPSTPRTYWTGAISSWGVDLVKRGFTVTINNAAITYGNAANPLDLSNFDVFIVPEPNNLFTAAEAAAIKSFVRDGGGLIAIGDHDVSDRNGDGIDSPKSWNALDPTFEFGVHWGSTGDANANIVQTSSNVNAAPSDSITRGIEGNVAALAFHNGTTFTLHPEANPTVRGEVWMTGLPQTSLTGVMAASAQYGSGRVFFCGDSSPIDDGSAQAGNSNIFDGWAEVADSLLFMNATQWASRRAAPAGDLVPPSVTLTAPNGGEDWKAGSAHAITWSASDNVAVTAIDLAWSGDGGATFANAIATGLANSGSFSWTVPDTANTDVRVRVTARDAASNTAADASNASFAISRWQVTASAGTGGGISPFGLLSVAQGASLTFRVTPNAGFGIADVFVDGASQGAPDSVKLVNITANHTVAASFADVQAPSLAMSAPVGGEVWDINTTHAITWSATDNSAVDTVSVDWSAHGSGGPWLNIAHALANSGSLDWLVPAAPTDSALVRVTAYDVAGNSTTIASASLFTIKDNAGVGDNGPAVLALARPMPNPAHGATALHFSLPAAGSVRLEVLDVTGRRLWGVAQTVAPGAHTLAWDGRDDAGHTLGAGLYLVRLVTPWGAKSTRLAWVR